MFILARLGWKEDLFISPCDSITISASLDVLLEVVDNELKPEVAVFPTISSTASAFRLLFCRVQPSL